MAKFRECLTYNFAYLKNYLRLFRFRRYKLSTRRDCILIKHGFISMCVSYKLGMYKVVVKKNSVPYPFSDINSKETSALQIVHKRDTFHANMSPGHDAKIVRLVV